MSDQIHHPSEEADTNSTTGDTTTDDNGDFAVSVDHENGDPGNADTASDTNAASELGQDTGTEG